jgi:multidrug efflux pump
MKITELSVDRSTTTFVLLVIFLITGVYSWVALPRESAPEVIVPFINVTTTYEGVAPSDMESLVTIPIERKLTGLSDVKQIKSISAEGVSSITIEFVSDTDIDDALQKVRDKVDLAKQDIPDIADDPIISEINISEFPIMMISLAGDIGLAALNEIAEDLEDRIEAVKGVLNVDIIGGVEREIQIIADPERIAEYGIPLSELLAITRQENVNTPGGSLDLGEAKFNMRTPGEFRTPEDITGLVVKQGEYGSVYLRDLAEVRDGFKELTSRSRVNGRPSITIAVSKRTGENIIEVADSVNAILNQFRDELPPGVTVGVTQDQSKDIRSMVRELENNILSGLLLVLIVIFIFLGLVNAFLVALAIPVSMFITLTVIYASGVTLNFVVLFSLIMALGMLVDNGIVIVENIYRHYQHGEDRFTAAKKGAAEVSWPITTSTLTTVMAFLPMFFWPGVWGDFMVYLPMTVCTALGASLFVGLVVNPALASVFMRGKRHEIVDGKAKRHRILELYGGLLRLALRWRSVTVTCAVMVLVVIAGVYFPRMDMEFVPATEPRQAIIDIDAPEGTNLAAADELVRQVETAIEPHRGGIDFVISSVGSQSDPSMGAMGGSGGASSHKSRVTLVFPELQDAPVLPSVIISEIRMALKDISGADIRVEKQEHGPPTNPPVNVEISGDDYDTLTALADQIVQRIESVPALLDLRDDFSKGKPEVRVVVDRQQAWRNGLSTQFVGEVVKAAINGTKAGDFREGEDEYDVVVRFPDKFRQDLANVHNMNVINAFGYPIPFAAVATIEQGAGLGVIRRIDRKRTVTVSAEVDKTIRTPQSALEEVESRLKDFAMPPGYSIAYTGENEDTDETMAFLEKAFVVAILLIALVLITQFNSIIQPFIILMSVVLSLAGVFLGLLLLDMTFVVIMTGIGCISLAGVVVNNAIVLIDFINKLREEGRSTHDAIVEACTIRFRPVLLTAVTTILGLIPMASGVSFDFFEFRWIIGGDSSQWWGPMAVAVIFGLAFATLLTLIVVPTLYSLLDSMWRNAVRILARKPAPEPIEIPAK